ncbi:MAG: putative redox protein [Polaribacter sp.]|jgi:putative redox protein
MKITLKSTDNLDHYTATNEAGHSIALSADGSATGPMEAVLMAVAGCSTVDIVMILKKMRQDVTNVEVEVDGTRREEIPRVYTGIHLHYKIYGEAKDKKVEQAVALSLEKYCSVSLMLGKAVTISSSWEVLSAD